MSVPASSTYNGWWDDRENGQYDLYYRGTLIGHMTETGLVMVIATAVLGYATGAGGAVTQLTDKGTGVTLNTVCGTITTDNAALGAAAEITFIVTNSVVAIGDVIVLSIQSGGTSGEYLAHVTDVGAGVFDITLANMSASSASDVVLINFAILKAVSA